MPLNAAGLSQTNSSPALLVQALLTYTRPRSTRATHAHADTDVDTQTHTHTDTPAACQALSPLSSTDGSSCNPQYAHVKRKQRRRPHDSHPESRLSAAREGAHPSEASPLRLRRDGRPMGPHQLDHCQPSRRVCTNQPKLSVRANQPELLANQADQPKVHGSRRCHVAAESTIADNV
jgi:hypothetical protein